MNNNNNNKHVRFAVDDEIKDDDIPDPFCDCECVCSYYDIYNLCISFYDLFYIYPKKQ